MASRTSFWPTHRRVVVNFPVHPAPWVAIKTVANCFTQPRGRFHQIPRAPGMRFGRHGRIYRPMWGKTSSEACAGGPPPAGRPRPQTPERAGRNTPSPIVSMSSDRLFLDRVGRHQSPSPLHRHEQINMHFTGTRAKGDISTLPATRHFYFALTTGRPTLKIWPLQCYCLEQRCLS